MAEETTTDKRKKPDFQRRDNHKKIRYGKGVKKNQKWRAAKGRQNKVRLGRRGYPLKPSPGYGEDKELKGKIQGFEPKRIENLNELIGLKSGEGIIIASVGKKKKQELIAKANEMKLIILNRYKREDKK